MKPLRHPPHVVAVLLILVLAIVIGFAFDGVATLTERSTHPRDYSVYVERYAAEYDIPTSVVYAVIYCESSFDASAVSSAGAIGLMQLTPETYEWLCTRTGEAYIRGLLYDPATNIRYGSYLLSILYRRYGNWPTAYAAYNAGIGNVDSWLDDPTLTDENGFLTSIPFKETRGFVEKVTKHEEIYRRLYG